VKRSELLERNEGKTLEYKWDLSSPDGILRTLVAFANTAGGTVVIGVDDGSKNVRGVPDSLEAEEKLANLVADSIRPHLRRAKLQAKWTPRRRTGPFGLRTDSAGAASIVSQPMQ